MKEKFIKTYLSIAEQFAALSSARRLKVGAIIVKDDRIISVGYNGTPSGWDNNCEYETSGPDHQEILTTKKEVIHAEANAIYKLAQSNDSGKGATMFCTHSPCEECAKAIMMSGIREFYYSEGYKDTSGVSLLVKSGMFVQEWSKNS